LVAVACAGGAMLLTMVFFGGFFLGSVETLINAHTLPGQTKGLKGGFKEWVDVWVAKVDSVFLRLGGFSKVDNRFG
jgi:hypothetical protein